MLIAIKQNRDNFKRLKDSYTVYATHEGYIILNNQSFNLQELVKFFYPFDIKKATFEEYSDSWVIEELKEELKKHEH
jgi:hypothetical protein